MSSLSASKLQKFIDERHVHLAIEDEEMLITKTVLKGDKIDLHCGRSGTTLGGSEEPIRVPKSVRTGSVLHMFDSEGENVSLHFGSKK
jgi:hypothetical protein